jgi:HSP20 family molecular chaperone IbpA
MALWSTVTTSFVPWYHKTPEYYEKERRKNESIRQMNSFIDSFKTNKVFSNSYWKSENDSFVLTIDIPGYKKSEINVSIVDHLLRVHCNNEKRSKHTYRYSLPSNADPDTLHASLENGVLTITINKTTKNVKSIEIK